MRSSYYRLPIETKRLIIQALTGHERILRHDHKVQEEKESAAGALRAVRDNRDTVYIRALAPEYG